MVDPADRKEWSASSTSRVSCSPGTTSGMPGGYGIRYSAHVRLSASMRRTVSTPALSACRGATLWGGTGNELSGVSVTNSGGRAA